MEFYNKNNIKDNLTFPDIYFTKYYGESCEFSDNAEWECCVYLDAIYVYLKIPIVPVIDDKVYYNLITPYGYSGYYFKHKTTYDEFLNLFRAKAIERNYVQEILRQNPYINIEITNYDKINSKLMYGIKVDTFENYWKNVLNSKKRNMFTKALKNNLKFKITKVIDSSLERFIELYNLTMNKVNATPYYYFNKKYFKSLENIENSYLSEVIDSNNTVIGSSIIFVYDNFVHYHLSCNDDSINCITDYLLINIVKQLGENKLIILGCGLNDNDSLSKFKKSLSNVTFTYTIYKNILNKDIYNLLENSK
jgi:hypothetical protein